MRPCDGMRLFLYDSAFRKIVPFAPSDPERVRIYTCGPTVYRYAHIGNLRTCLLTDLLVRTLRFFGYGTFAVQNITDMGHMHQERLEVGEDKVIAAARAAGKRTDEAIHRHKKRAEDFTLWMPAEPDREFQWESRWGAGWPGWHIECAAGYDVVDEETRRR